MLYTTLAKAGYWPEDWLDTFMGERSKLNGHPNRSYLAGVQARTGPLGRRGGCALGAAEMVFGTLGVRADRQ